MKRAAILVTILLCLCLQPIRAEETKPATPPPESDHPSEAKPAEKPYGCFRDLRWGMKPDDVAKSLDVKLKKMPLMKDRYYVQEGIKIGASSYVTGFIFDESGGLKEVDINPKEFPVNDRDFIKLRIRLYQELKPALVKKFGEPTRKEEVDLHIELGDTFVDSVLTHAGILLSEWQTDESLISLTVERDPKKFPTPDATLLVYKKSARLQQAKPATDL